MIPILALDTETSGLNAQEFRLGCVMKEDEIPHIFTDKHEMLQFVKEEARKEGRRGHNTFNYAHNMEYDAYAFTELKDKLTRYISFRPFIAIRRNAWLLDTVAITREPLSEVAEWVGMQKGETPSELINGISKEEFEKNFELRARTAHYCANDTLIVMRLVKVIKQKLKDEGIHIKHLVSAGQIGSSVFLNHVRKMPIADSWINKATRGFIGMPTTAIRKKSGETLYYNRLGNRISEEEHKNILKGDLMKEYKASDELINRACRGARVQAFKTGRFENTWYFDANSLYPHILSTMNLPNLAAGERPAGMESLDTDSVGVARAIIRKPEGMIGIPVRTTSIHGVSDGEGHRTYKERRTELAFPRQEATICGTYTLMELRAFREAGCKISDVRGIEYHRISNHLRAFIQEKYDLRQHSKFEKAFWKLVLNNIVGKFAQKRESKEIKFNGLETEREMKEDGFKLKDITENMGMYVKSHGIYRGKAYCPILYAMVTAGARLELWKKMQQIDENDLYYCDTDSLLVGNGQKYKDTTFKMGTGIGEWKLEGTDTLTVWGKKTYSFGENKLVAAGASKRQTTPEMARTGTLKYKKMVGMRGGLEEAGTFTEEERELSETTERHNKFEEKIAKTRIFIDAAELRSATPPSSEDIRKISELSGKQEPPDEEPPKKLTE